MTNDAPLIVFICTANICRSPWAEARAAQLMPGYRWSSAGVRASTGRPMDPVMGATLPGGSHLAHRSQPLSRRVAEDSALILTMDSGHRALVLEEFPTAIRKTFTLGQFVETARSAPSGLALDELITWCFRNRSASGPRTDVADPYGLGASHARATADLLEALTTELAAQLPGMDQC